MSYVSYDHIADKQKTMCRLVRNLEEVGPDMLSASEECEYRFDQDVLGVWVGVKSLRQQQLLEQLRKKVFPNFAWTGMKAGSGMHWTWFRLGA